MIVCDDYFLNDESILKTMLRIFERRIIWIFRLKSISWDVFFLSFKRKARDVCMCMCVYVCVCLCVWKKIRIKSVVCEKNLSFVEFKDFYFLKSIFKLIARSFVNIKKREEIYFVDEIQIFFILFYFANIFLFNLILILVAIFFLEILWNLRFLSHRLVFSKWSFLIFSFLSRIMFMNRR
jgi:hypothetical protein